jgi:hypothetical protein
MGNHGSGLSLVLAAAVLLIPAALAPAEAPSSGDERIVIETEATLKAGLASIEISSPIRASRVYVDSTYVGVAPYAADIAPGIHVVRVEAPGCYPLSVELALAEKTLYRIAFNPALVKGRLHVRLEPASATLSLEGQSIDPGFLELPVGSYTLVARRFGYAEESRAIRIDENSTTFVDISLEKAAFEVANFRATRAAFNPGNAGAAGRTDLAFTATTYGSASASIIGPDGAPVRVIDFPRIATWKQSRAWDGRGEDGAPLPDGTYLARLVAVPDPGVATLPEGPLGGGPAAGEVAADGSIVLETEVRIDSEIRVRALGPGSAMPGLLAFPDPLPQPAGTTAVEATWLVPAWDASGSAIGLSLAGSLGGAAVLSFSGAAELEGGGAADLAASLLLSLLADRASGSGGAAFLRASWTSAAAPSMPESRSAIELSLPWTLALGDFRLGAAPGALLDFSSSPELLALARAGLWLDAGPLRAGLSGMMPFGLGLGDAEAGPRWPARIAAEARLMIGASPLTISAYPLADLDPGSGPRLLAGLGVGLLF